MSINELNKNFDEIMGNLSNDYKQKSKMSITKKFKKQKLSKKIVKKMKQYMKPNYVKKNYHLKRRLKNLNQKKKNTTMKLLKKKKIIKTMMKKSANGRII